MKDNYLKPFPGNNVDASTTLLLPTPNYAKPVKKDKYATIRERLLNAPGPIGQALRDKKYVLLRKMIKEIRNR